jgi:NAD(P)-dependent dehydrogenase (short-subunit alcohol dehydrogenase family)
MAGPTSSFTPDDYLNLLDTNAVGAFRLIREVVPHMQKQKSGRIVNITSLNGLVSLPNFGLYSSSKFAFEALGLALRYELAKDGILVTNIAPGAIASPAKFDMPHKSAREKFWLLKILMPMISYEKVAQAINSVLKDDMPPARVLLGADAKITFFLYRFLPISLWDNLMFYIWNKK